MSNIFVSAEEIKRMTGHTDKAGQCSCLANHWNIPYRETPKGWPLVLISDAEKTLGLNRLLSAGNSLNDSGSISEPDFSSVG